MVKRGSPIKSDPIVRDSDDESDGPVAGSSKGPPAKKVKAEPERAVGDEPATSDGGALKTNDQGDRFCELGSRKRITVRKYNKAVLVDIREYYVDKATDEEKPGKKGISLTLPQFEELKKHLDAVSQAAEALR